MKYKGDIIITDPCYIKHTQGDNAKPKGSFRDTDCVDCPTPSMMSSDTYYGDWSCHTFKGSDINTPRSEDTVLGGFCADAGMVCVAPLKEILDIDPDFLTRQLKHTYTLIKDFDGDVEFLVNKVSGTYTNARGEVVPYSEDELHVIGTGNIPFHTAQTGF